MVVMRFGLDGTACFTVVLLVSGSANSARPRVLGIVIRLAGAGGRLLRGAGRLGLLAGAGFTLTHRASVSAAGVFTLSSWVLERVRGCLRVVGRWPGRVSGDGGLGGLVVTVGVV
jgi:hypothetical protein